MAFKPFEISIPQKHLDDLQSRLVSARWPQPIPGQGWELGADTETLRRLVWHWQDGYDWRSHERAMNELPHFIGDDLHFLHFRQEGFPLLLSHGWPGSFLEIAPLAQRLAAKGFDVVVPSLPGFGFSPQQPEATDPWSTPELFHALMQELGYKTYGAHGGDLGAGITARLAARHPEAVAGIHVLAVKGPNEAATDDERAFLKLQADWIEHEGAYEHEQMTRPLTLAYGLSDSPVGLLAWLTEKYRGWSDSGGDLSTRFSDDDVLTWTSLYWLTNTILPSFRPYNDHYARPVEQPYIGVPTALAVFPHDLVQPPREYAERGYNLVRYTRMPRGGHFAAFEEPDLLANDIAEFFQAAIAATDGA